MPIIVVKEELVYEQSELIRFFKEKKIKLNDVIYILEKTHPYIKNKYNINLLRRYYNVNKLLSLINEKEFSDTIKHEKLSGTFNSIVLALEDFFNQVDVILELRVKIRPSMESYLDIFISNFITIKFKRFHNTNKTESGVFYNVK